MRGTTALSDLGRGKFSPACLYWRRWSLTTIVLSFSSQLPQLLVSHLRYSTCRILSPQSAIPLFSLERSPLRRISDSTTATTHGPSIRLLHSRPKNLNSLCSHPSPCNPWRRCRRPHRLRFRALTHRRRGALEECLGESGGVYASC